jgi:hypothetical protein
MGWRFASNPVRTCERFRRCRSRAAVVKAVGFAERGPLFAIGLMIVVAACSPRDYNIPSGCGASGVILWLDPSTVAASSYPLTARTCVDGVCEYTDLLEPPIMEPAGLWRPSDQFEETSARTASVSVELTDAHGARLAKGSTKVRVERKVFDSGQTCHLARLSFDGSTGVFTTHVAWPSS